MVHSLAESIAHVSDECLLC